MVQGYSGNARYKGGIDVARKVIKADGIRGLYRGFGLSVMTYAPSSAVWWASYGSSQRIIWRLGIIWLTHHYVPLSLAHSIMFNRKRQAIHFYIMIIWISIFPPTNFSICTSWCPNCSYICNFVSWCLFYCVNIYFRNKNAYQCMLWCADLLWWSIHISSTAEKFTRISLITNQTGSWIKYIDCSIHWQFREVNYQPKAKWWVKGMSPHIAFTHLMETWSVSMLLLFSRACM